MKGVVAAGHPLTAQAGADVLREGGNAVDAAIAAMLMSWVAESPLTGPAPAASCCCTPRAASRTCSTSSSRRRERTRPGQPAELVPIEVRFSEDAVQVFHIGPASNGVYGNPLGIAITAKRFGSMPLADLAAPAARAARDGIEVTPMMRQFFEVLEPILTHTEEARAIYAPEGSLLDVGETIRMPYVGDLIERLGAEGPAFLYEGDVARAVSEWVLGARAERSPSATSRSTGSSSASRPAPATTAARSSPTRRRPPAGS